MKRVFNPALKAAGLRRIRFHGLRHTCATMFVDLGENPKLVQQQLRHATVQMTLDRYSHLYPDAGQAAGQRLDTALFESANIQLTEQAETT